MVQTVEKDDVKNVGPKFLEEPVDILAGLPCVRSMRLGCQGDPVATYAAQRLCHMGMGTILIGCVPEGDPQVGGLHQEICKPVDSKPGLFRTSVGTVGSCANR